MLDYDTGLDKYFGLVQIAEKYEIFKKVSTRFEMPDGTKVFEKAIIKNPEKYFTDDIMKQLEDAVFQEFNYGSKKGDQEDDETQRFVKMFMDISWYNYYGWCLFVIL